MIPAFIQRARRRFLWNEVIAQFALGAALAMGATILLLLLGTQLLDWRWLAALCVSGLGLGLWRTRQRIPNAYQVAVALDQRAELHDAFSTALFFSDPNVAPRVSAAVRDAQREQAERLLPGVSLEAAVPFTMPRAMYAMGVLGLIASSLLALRYGIHRQLDLRPPLSQVVMDGFGLSSPEARAAAAQKKREAAKKRPDLLDDPGMALAHSDEKRAGDLDPATNSALDQVGAPDANNEKAQSASVKNPDSKAESGDQVPGDEKAEAQEGGNQASSGKNPSDNPAGSREGPQQGEQGASQQPSQGNSSSLLSKIKDAMQNLMSKATQQPNGAGGQKPSTSQGQQKSQSQQAKNGEKGAGGQNQQGESQESAESQAGQQAGESDSQDAPGKGGGKSADQQAAAQPGSGVGKQDGAKDLKAAQQLAAMGKLSEIIGKRSANVSGEMVIEKQSGPQQLKTAYSERSASHGEGGGDVSRDEVPVALQNYVQQYFEQVRKGEKSSGAAPRNKASKP